MAKVDTTKIVVGRSAVFSKQQEGRVLDIGGGKTLWQGRFASFLPAWKLFVNVDMANKPAYEEDSVISFCYKVLGGKR